MTPALNLVGLRFNGLSIPQGATITNASIQLTAAASSSAAVNLTIKAQAADNPGTFAATPGDISNRSTTTAGVNWMPGAWTGGSTTNATTPDLTSIVQEIVNRPGWSAGNSMVFVTTDNGTTYPNRRQALSFEHPFVGPAVLTVTYNARYSVPANAACEIRVAAAQAPLSGLNLTTANAPQPANANASATDNHPITDVADSDAILSGSSAVIAFTTGGTGQNNHGLDFGYRAEDWGDLPDTYNTLHSNNGAYHVIDATNPTPRLGACVDGEATGQPNDTALGDDSADSPLDFGDACSDDEDGVTAVGNWTLGTGHLLITVSGAQACLNAWMDFATNAGAVQAGGDGSFGDSAGAISEWILQNEVIAEGLNQPLNFPLPVGLPAGSYYLRYRLTPNLGDTATCADDMSAYAGGSPTWSGAAKGGEVEDHRVDSAPLAVLLAGFEASAQPDHILVAWETVSELNNTGFNLYRSLSPSDQPALLGFTPSAAPGSNSGVAYRFQDFDVQPGLTYWYWLDAVDHSGAATRFDPVSATFQSPTAVALGRLTAGAAAANSTALLGVALAVLLALAAAALLRGRRNAAA
jgi:hypothetical protein